MGGGCPLGPPAGILALAAHLCHQGVMVRESPFGAELEDAPFVLEVCGLHYGLLGEVSNDSGGGPRG